MLYDLIVYFQNHTQLFQMGIFFALLTRSICASNLHFDISIPIEVHPREFIINSAQLINIIFLTVIKLGLLSCSDLPNC